MKRNGSSLVPWAGQSGLVQTPLAPAGLADKRHLIQQPVMTLQVLGLGTTSEYQFDIYAAGEHAMVLVTVRHIRFPASDVSTNN